MARIGAGIQSYNAEHSDLMEKESKIPLIEHPG
jgi:hypothetical protein